MNKATKRIITSLFISLFALSISFILSSNDKAANVYAASYENGTVKVSSNDTLNVRVKGNSSARILTKLKTGTKVKCWTLKATWVKITANGYTGYANGNYILTAYGTATQPYKNVRSGTVNTSLTIRKTKSASGVAVATVAAGQKLQVLTTAATWVKVKYNGKTGYTEGKYITCGDGKTAAGTVVSSNTSTSYVAAKRAAVIAYAKLFIGNKYVYGGTSLTNGCDCSGFTQAIYKHFGYSIPRTSIEQRYCGTAVASLASAQPGDLICYYGHVALFIGKYTTGGVTYPYAIVHASNGAPYPAGGIKITTDCRYRAIAAIRRIIK